MSSEIFRLEAEENRGDYSFKGKADKWARVAQRMAPSPSDKRIRAWTDLLYQSLGPDAGVSRNEFGRLMGEHLYTHGSRFGFDFDKGFANSVFGRDENGNPYMIDKVDKNGNAVLYGYDKNGRPKRTVVNPESEESLDELSKGKFPTEREVYSEGYEDDGMEYYSGQDPDDPTDYYTKRHTTDGDPLYGGTARSKDKTGDERPGYWGYMSPDAIPGPDLHMDALGGETEGPAAEGPVPEQPAAEPQQGGPRIVINPTVFDDDKDALCVAFNEAFRIIMEMNDFVPQAEPTEAQRKFFADTAYAEDEVQLRRTILARICTFDTSIS